MIEFISVAEFHETEGQKILFSYPGLPKNIENCLASYILPEGLHKFGQESILMIFRTKKNFDRVEDHPK